MADTTLADKIALVTGANKGIGKEIARQLGQQGATVLIGARDAGRGEEAATELRGEGIDAQTLVLDVTKPDVIAAAAEQIQRRYGKLDILVNNAGINAGGMPAPSETTMEDLREVYETNFFGVFAVTRALLPLLKQAEAARIVNVSSTLGSLTLNSDPNWDYASVKPLGYNSSKAALNMMTVIFAAEFKNTPIKINAINPGYAATDLNQHQGYLTPEQAAKVAVRLATIPADGPNGKFFSEEGEEPW